MQLSLVRILTPEQPTPRARDCRDISVCGGRDRYENAGAEGTGTNRPACDYDSLFRTQWLSCEHCTGERGDARVCSAVAACAQACRTCSVQWCCDWDWHRCAQFRGRREGSTKRGGRQRQKDNVLVPRKMYSRFMPTRMHLARRHAAQKRRVPTEITQRPPLVHVSRCAQQHRRPRVNARAQHATGASGLVRRRARVTVTRNDEGLRELKLLVN